MDKQKELHLLQEIGTTCQILLNSLTDDRRRLDCVGSVAGNTNLKMELLAVPAKKEKDVFCNGDLLWVGLCLTIVCLCLLEFLRVLV